jgi:hypothetical protein
MISSSTHRYCSQLGTCVREVLRQRRYLIDCLYLIGDLKEIGKAQIQLPQVTSDIEKSHLAFPIQRAPHSIIQSVFTTIRSTGSCLDRERGRLRGNRATHAQAGTTESCTPPKAHIATKAKIGQKHQERTREWATYGHHVT